MNIKTNKAFTIVELLVAMALVVILMGLSSLVFTTGVKAHRTADSTVEVVRRAESICQQLSNDLRGLQTDAPMAIWFEVDPATGKRYDQIQFFANGDFQTIKQYAYWYDSNSDGIVDRFDKAKTVDGNVSRVYYGQAWQFDTATAAPQKTYRLNHLAPYQNLLPSNLLSRRAHLLTSDTSLYYSFPVLTTFNTTFLPPSNNGFEYDTLSLTDWQNLVQINTNNDRILQTCFNSTGTFDTPPTGRPMIDMKNSETLHLLLSEQISSFQVQWAYRSEDQIKNTTTGETFGVNERFNGVQWWPDYSRSDFYQAGFGAYFNMPGGVSGTMSSSWKTVGVGGHQSDVLCFSPTYYPRAIKFTFTVHDVKGLFPEGRTFTHIVYIEN